MNISLVAQRVKCLPAVQETQVLSLGWEDPLEKEMQPTPVFLSGKSPWTEEPGWATVHGVAKSQTQLSDFHIHFTMSMLFLSYSPIPENRL